VNQNNNTCNDSQDQGIATLWAEQIKAIFPTDLDESAKTWGALIRKREVKSAIDLLRLLLLCAVSTMSMRMLTLSAKSLKVADISDTAVRKRLIKSIAWLTLLLNTLLPSPTQNKMKPGIKRTVHLIDGSNYVKAGKSGETYRVHMSYNLSINSMDEVKVTDKHTAESFAHYSIQAGDIYIADAGYGKANNYVNVTKRGGDVIFRCTPNHIKLEDLNGSPIEMAKKLDKEKQVVDFTCFIINGKKKTLTRIVASQLPEDKKAESVKRKKRQASKRQTKQIRPETLIYAEWVIILTSLDGAYSAEEVLAIYRSRWQVELLFKRIKQHFKVTKIRPCSAKYGEALVLLWLIIWALVERQSYLAELYLLEKGADMSRCSQWQITSYFFERQKILIEMQWAILLDPMADIEIIAEKLQNHKRHDRPNQNFEYRFNNDFQPNDCDDKSEAA